MPYNKSGRKDYQKVLIFASFPFFKKAYSFDPLARRDYIVFQTKNSLTGYTGDPISDFNVIQTLAVIGQQATLDKPGSYEDKLKSRFQTLFEKTIN